MEHYYNSPLTILERIVEPSYRHLFLVPAEGLAARQLTNGDYNQWFALMVE